LLLIICLNHRHSLAVPQNMLQWRLAARAYLQDLKYTEAKPLLDAIIASDKYSLMDKFIENFEIATNNNKESIFEIQANVNDINESLKRRNGYRPELAARW
jgi:hypothetical protein